MLGRHGVCADCAKLFLRSLSFSLDNTGCFDYNKCVSERILFLGKRLPRLFTMDFRVSGVCDEAADGSTPEPVFTCSEDVMQDGVCRTRRFPNGRVSFARMLRGCGVVSHTARRSTCTFPPALPALYCDLPGRLSGFRMQCDAAPGETAPEVLCRRSGSL